MSNARPGIFCRSCGYDLRSLTENRCPECGREFDPGQRRTYDLKPRRRALTRWIGRIALLAVIAIVTLSGMIGWTWRGYERDQQARERLKNFGIIRQELAPMPVIEHLLPQRYQYLRTRVWSVCVDSEKFTNDDWDQLPRLPCLRDVRLGRVPPNPAVLRRMESLKELTHLSMTSKNINDDYISRLAAKMPKLRELGLLGGNISDRGIARLAALKDLQWLRISGPEISDASLLSLAQMPSLRQITLLSSTNLSDEAIAQFKARRPDVKFN
jgi:hypothetical protein